MSLMDVPQVEVLFFCRSCLNAHHTSPSLSVLRSVHLSAQILKQSRPNAERKWNCTPGDGERRKARSLRFSSPSAGDFPPPQQEIFLLLERKIAALTAEIAIEFPSAVQGREKLKELSFETHVPSAPIGCAWAGHFAWQK